MTAALRDGLAACGVGPADRLLVAVSGGLDSTALLRLLVEIGHPVVACHVDHGLRPDSGEDAAFVAALTAGLGVPCIVRAVSVGEGNVQAEARLARYAALADAARAEGCAAVATGHTADDQAETVLLALGRGAGLRGLAGMPPRRALAPGVDLLRPLLHTPRSVIQAHAAAAGWTWRDDPSNATVAYRRNRLRHRVLPALRDEFGDDAVRKLAASADAARAALGLVGDRLAGLADREGRVALDGLAALDVGARRLVLAEAVARFAPDATRSRVLVDRLAALVVAEVGSLVESGGLSAWRERDAIRIGPSIGPPFEGTFESTPLVGVPETFPADPFEEIVDADRMAGDPVVRPWQAGDRIRPLGLGGSQLVSDILRSRGVPRAARGAVPVVEVGGRVAWVVGHRLAAFAALTESTRRAARWSWRADGGPG